MYGGSGTSPYFAIVCRASSAPTNRTFRIPPPRTSTTSPPLSPSPKLTCRPGLSFPPGCPIASQVPSGRARTSRISAAFPDSRLPRSLAGITRDVLRTSTSSAGINSATSGNFRWVMTPVARSSTSRRLEARSGRGSWAIWSAGRSYSKSEALWIKDVRLFGARGRREAEMAISTCCGAATARRAREEPLLHQKGLVHLLERAGVLTDGRGDRLHTDGPALEHFDDRLQDPRVHVVEPELVDVEPLERLHGHGRGDLPGGAHLRVVAHALQEAVRDARRAAAAARDLHHARGVGGNAQDPRGAGDDLDEVVGRIVVQPLHEAEARAHRRRQQAEARRRADQREALELHRNRLGVRAVGDADIDVILFHRGVEELFERRTQPVHLVDEQDVAALQAGEHAHEIAGPLEHGPGGGPDVDVHFLRHEERESRLAESRGAEEQRVVERLLAVLGRVDRDLQRLLHFRLTDELVESGGTQRGVGESLVGERLGCGDLGAGHPLFALGLGAPPHRSRVGLDRVLRVTLEALVVGAP